nr:endoribonuclease YBEY, chloroplastic [Tanacetum cinerariifolium]
MHILKQRDPAIDDVGQYESVELSILLCNDEFSCELNKDWRNEADAIDVLSMSQDVSELKFLMAYLSTIVVRVQKARAE